MNNLKLPNSIDVLNTEIKRLQDEIKVLMITKGKYDSKLELLIGEHYTAIELLKIYVK